MTFARLFPIWFFAATLQEIRKGLQYRFEFWVTSFSIAIGQLTIACAVWSTMFRESGAATLGTYSLEQLLWYSVLAALCGAAIRPQFGTISREIYEGDLNKYLVYPISHFGLHLSFHIGHSLVAILQAGLALSAVVLASSQITAQATPGWCVAAALVSTLLAMVLIFSSNYLFELIGFWADEVWALAIFHHFLMNTLGGTVFPLTLFPAWVQDILYHLPPALVFALPIETLLGRRTPQEWVFGVAMTLLWILILIPIRMELWRRGRKQYSGVGM